MRRFILDTGIAGLYFNRKRGVFERAAEAAAGSRVGVAGPIIGELAFRGEGIPKREENLLRLREALEVRKVRLADVPAAFEYGWAAFELKTVDRTIAVTLFISIMLRPTWSGGEPSNRLRRPTSDPNFTALVQT